MEKRAARTLILLLLVVLMCAVQLVSGEQKQHVVGGRKRGNGWAPNINYTTWAAGERFYVGDWLTFFYEKGYYDVVQVNETDYERCSADHPLKNESKGNSYSFQLNHTGPYYFICSRGQCWSGMKLAVTVLPAPPPAPSPSSSATSSSAAAPAPWPASMVSAVCAVLGLMVVI